MSMSGLPRVLHFLFKMLESSCHSRSSWNSIRWLSSSVFNSRYMLAYYANIYLIQCSHIALEIRLHSLENRPTHFIVIGSCDGRIEESEPTRMCLLLISIPNDWMLNKIIRAFNSKALMWGLLNPKVHWTPQWLCCNLGLTI